MVTAATEGHINHARLRELSTEHSADITKMLGRLVRDGLLGSEGIGRGMVYFLSSQHFPRRDLLDLTDGSGPLAQESVGLTPELGGLTPELALETGSADRLPQELRMISVTELAELDAADLEVLRALALPVSDRQRVPPEVLRQTVLALCAGRYLGLRVLAALLNRRDQGGGDLRKRILNPLVQEGLLLRAFPNANDPRQAYLTNPQAASKQS